MATMEEILAAAKWVLDHPHFNEKPATIMEFIGPGYLDIEKKVRQGLKDTLQSIFGKEVNGNRIANFEEAMVTGGIGIGKTTFASIALPYMVHWTLCLKDPQDFFELLPGSRIAFMQMSTSEDQALQVIFGDIKARVDHSDWFVQNFPRDTKFTKQIRFPKDIWILPGDSQETTFEGYNILAGILDEMDSHKVTKDKDYADEGFNTIQSRIASRFIDTETNGHRGLLICIGQMKKGDGFAARKYEEMLKNPRAHVTRMAIWESLGWDRYLKDDGTRDSFWYDRKRKMIVPAAVSGVVDNDDIMEIPTAYKQQFFNNPEKALRDLAGIPPATNDPFISLVDRIDECRERWIMAHLPEGQDWDEKDRSTIPYPVGTNPRRPEFAEWFRADNDPRRRTIHLDIATSGDGDALGLVMGHIDRMVDIDGELKPHIVIDCMIRIKVSSGQEIILSDIRQLIYRMKNELKFRIVNVTMDGFQSTDTMQQLRKKKFFADYLSVDRSTLPYEDLREAIYERRLDFPPYVTNPNPGDVNLVEIAIKELQQLSFDGKKVDHPATGSKDVADGLAGVVSTLMGDRTYRRGVTSTRTPDAIDESNTGFDPSPTPRRNSFDPAPNGQPVPYGNLSLLPKRLRGR